MVIDPEYAGEAKDGDLVEVEVARLGRFGLPRAKVLSIVGSVASEKAISMIAIYAHGIPHVFPPAVIAEADAAKPATMSHREECRQAVLSAGAGGDRRPAGRQDRADAGVHPEAAMARVQDHAARPRPASAARTRHAGTQDPAEAGRHGRSRHRAAASRRP